MDGRNDTIPRMLHHWATHQPDTAAFVFVDSAMNRRVLSRADVYRLASRYAAILRRGDVRRGDVVCNTLLNSPERVVSDLGIILTGAVALNGQLFLADGSDFLGSLRDSASSAIVLDPLQPKGAASVLDGLEKEELEDGRVRFNELPALRRLFRCRCQGREGLRFMDMLEQEQESYVADVNADDLAYVWTTSGSTGFSKLVPHTHARALLFGKKFSMANGMTLSPLPAQSAEDISLTENGSRIQSCHSRRAADHGNGAGRADDDTGTDRRNDQVDMDGIGDQTELKSSDAANSGERHTADGGRDGTTYADHVYFNNGRLGWSGGFPGDFLALGTTRVLLDLSRGPPDDPVAAWWTVSRREGCQYAFFLPFHFQQLLSRPDLWRASSWRFRVVGLAGQPVHATLVKEAVGRLAHSVNVSYGSTEMGPTTCKAAVDPELYEEHNNGKPLPGVEVKVVDDSPDLQEVPPGSGQLGEVLVRADTSLEGYLSNDQATQKTLLPDGWCRTGDVGYINAEGDLFVICRTSFAIMRGAYVVHPGWLERCIRKHPAVRDVIVVPVPDRVIHQELCACVVPVPGTEVRANELREFCESLFLTERDDHMTAVPRYFLFFPQLPMTAAGKPCRHDVATEARRRLSAASSAE